MSDTIAFRVVRVGQTTSYAVILPDSPEGREIMLSIGQVIEAHGYPDIAHRIFRECDDVVAEITARQTVRNKLR